MAARIGERFPDDAQQLGSPAPEGSADRVGLAFECHGAVRRQRVVNLDELREGVREGAPAILLETEVVDRAAELAAHLLQDLRDLVVGSSTAPGDGEGVRQALQDLVVEIARDATALGVANLLEPALGGDPLRRRRDHVRDGLQ